MSQVLALNKVLAAPKVARRTIRRELDNPLSSMLLDGRIGAGRTARVGVEDGALSIEAVAVPTG